MSAPEERPPDLNEDDDSMAFDWVAAMVLLLVFAGLIYAVIVVVTSTP